MFADLDVQPSEFVAQHGVKRVDGALGAVVKLQGDDRVGAEAAAVEGCDFGDGAVDDGPGVRAATRVYSGSPSGCLLLEVSALRASLEGPDNPDAVRGVGSPEYAYADT